MRAPKTELEAEFDERSRSLMATGLDRKEAAEAIHQSDPDFFYAWQNEGEDDEDDDDKQDSDDDDGAASEKKKRKPGGGQPRAVPTDTTGKKAGAIAEWNGAIAAKRALGLSQREAVRQVVRENPGLQRRYLEAFNAAGREVPSVRSVGRHGAARSEWDAAVAAKMRTGLTHDGAARAVCKEQPQLRERLVAAANARP